MSDIRRLDHVGIGTTPSVHTEFESTIIQQLFGISQSDIQRSRYLFKLRLKSIGLDPLYPGLEEEPESMRWVSQYADANQVKTDFFEARSSAYAKSSAIEDDLDSL